MKELAVKNDKIRQSNFELLRIVAMLMIVAFHYSIFVGEQIYALPVILCRKVFMNKLFISILGSFGPIGSGLFFMITGFFLINKEKASIKKVVSETAFYSLAFCIIYVVLLFLCKITRRGIDLAFFDGNSLTGVKYIITSLLRPITYEWWFVTSYLVLLLCLPLINQLISLFSKGGFICFLFFVWFFYYSIDYVFDRNYLLLVKAFFFYISGAFIQLYLPKEISFLKKIILLLACISLLVIMTYCNFLENLFSHNLNGVQKDLFIALRDCISIPAFSFCLFLLFSTIKINDNVFINSIASSTFGIYLIHHSALCRRLIWRFILKKSEIWFTSSFFPLFSILYILLVFSLCAIIDLSRRKYIEPLYSILVEKSWEKIRASVMRTSQ